MMERIVHYLLIKLEPGNSIKSGDTNILIDTHWSGEFHCDDTIYIVGAMTRPTQETALKARIELLSTGSAF